MSPAKLNLGLEVLGRRRDGYHDIATIFLAVDLQDRLSLEPSDELEVFCNVAELEGAGNLALQALAELRLFTGVRDGARVVLDKHIPLAAGLGGASSNAAAALLAARELWRLPVSDEQLLEIAATLGSDVPFFLLGGCAMGRGRGEVLHPLPVASGLWFVIVVPRAPIDKKTATLYANLETDDFSNGERTTQQARRLLTGMSLDPLLLGNAFSRPLYAIAPSLASIPSALHAAGAADVALSGAGPAHYAPFTDRNAAESVAARLRDTLTDQTSIFVAQPIAERVSPARPL